MGLPGWAQIDVPTVTESFGVAKQVEFSHGTEYGHIPKTQNKVVNQDVTISWINTTIIGDYIASVFPEFSTSWLVQAQGNATLGSVADMIKQGLVTVDRKYLFLQLGGNQILSAENNVIFSALLNLVILIRERCKESRIFVLEVLPRPVENDNAKPYICKINRWLANAVERLDKMFQKN